MASCTSPSLTVESYEDITSTKASARDTLQPGYRRRHSSFHPRRKSADTMDGDEGLLLKVNTTPKKICTAEANEESRSTSSSPNSNED